MLTGKLENGRWAIEVKKRLRTLVLPFFIWSTIGFLSTLPVSLLNDVRLHQSLGSTFTQHINGINTFLSWAGLNLTQMPLIGALWYVRNLLILVVISPVLLWSLRRFSWWVIGGQFGILCLWKSMEFSLPSALNGFLWYGFSLLGVTAFSLGMQLRITNSALSNQKIGICTLLVGIGYWTLTHFYHLNMPAVQPIVLLCFAYSLWSFLPAWNLPTWLCQATFPIYLMHGIFLGYLQMFPRYIPGPTSIAGFFIHWLGPIVLSIIASVFLHKYLPRLTNVVFGQR